MLYCELLSLAGVEKGDVKEFEISEPSMKRLTNRKLICKIVELSTEYIKASEENSNHLLMNLERLALRSPSVQCTLSFGALLKIYLMMESISEECYPFSVSQLHTQCLCTGKA